MSLLLVDDQGKIWPGESRQLRVAFDSPYSGGEFIDYAVKNLGFAAINHYGTSAQVRLRPRFVTERAIEALRGWLQRSRTERIVLTTFDRDWRDELVLQRNAEARLDQLMMAGKPELTADLVARPVDRGALQSRPLISDIVDGWGHIITSYESEAIMRLLRAAFDGYHTVVRKAPDQDRVLFHEFGERMFPVYDTWRMCAIGAPIEEQPDRAYGRWVGQTYRQRIAADVPSVEDVDVILSCPVRGRTRLRYRRVLLPFDDPANGHLLFGGSVYDAAIDLRINRR